MWKYIAIIVFIILAIREINLMHESITLSPDAKKVIIEDKTITSKVILFIDKEKALLMRKTANQVTRKQKPKETNATVPAKEKTQKLPTLEKMETPPLKKEALEKIDKNAAPLKKAAAKKEPTHESKPKTVSPHAPVQETLEVLEKTEAHDLPKSYKSAEDRVNAILREMGR